jgi:hypothetical protein
MAEIAPCTISDTDLIGHILERVGSDLGMIIDREFNLSGIAAARENERAAGMSKVHISFKLRFRHADGSYQGCLLIPLPDAISLAAYLMMVPDDAVKAHRSTSTLDQSTKDAMLEVGNFVGGATDAVVRTWIPEKLTVRSEGCQGVRANIRPALVYEEGAELLVGRATARIHDFPDFEIVLMLPILPGL